MIRTKAGAPRRAGPRTHRSGALPGAGAAARAGARLRAALDRRARLTGRRPVRGAVALGLPAAWGAAALTRRLAHPPAGRAGLATSLAAGAVLLAAGSGLVLHARRMLLGDLWRARAAAGAAQSVVLRPLPARVDGLATAAVQLSADRHARVGGDLYEVVSTEYGVRVVIGDVRGHGLGAFATVAAVLGSFREAAHDEAELGSVLRRLDRALARHFRDRAMAEHPSSGLPPSMAPDEPRPVLEDFVTVLLLEIGRDGQVRALNCGHPWPYLLGGDRVELLDRAEPLPPLGPFPLPAELPTADCGPFGPGQTLFLHTDGVEDGRDAEGRFFPLPETLAQVVRNRPVSPHAVLGAVLGQLLRHTGGTPADDVAVLVLHNDRSPRGTPPAAYGTPFPATAGPPSAHHA